MKLHSVKTDADINELMEAFAYFHDSCIKELKYYSGTYVNNNRTMVMPIENNVINDVSIILQSQMADIPVIELKFKRVHKMNLISRGYENTYEIFSAVLFIHNNLIYWSEFDDFTVENSIEFDGTWISAEELEWRAVDNGLGDSEIYRADK